MLGSSAASKIHLTCEMLRRDDRSAQYRRAYMMLTQKLAPVELLPGPSLQNGRSGCPFGSLETPGERAFCDACNAMAYFSGPCRLREGWAVLSHIRAGVVVSSLFLVWKEETCLNALLERRRSSVHRPLAPCPRFYLRFPLPGLGRDGRCCCFTGTEGHNRPLTLFIIFPPFFGDEDGKTGRHTSLLSHDRP